jgi:hypothetical protein
MADIDAILERYNEVRNDFLSAIDGLNDELMTEPSLDGWSVKDHLVHLAAWDDLRTSEIIRVSAGHEPAWPRSMTRDHVQSFNALIHDLRQDLSLAQARWEFDTSRQRVLDAIRTAPPRGLEASHYGHVGVGNLSNIGGHEAEHTDMIRHWRARRGV